MRDDTRPEEGRASAGSEETVTATEAQNNFGRVLGRATRDGRVYITRYDRPAAVLLSIESYEALVGSESPDLEGLSREFDEMLARMQESETAAGVDGLFEDDGIALGEAAVRAAHRDRS